LTDLQVISASGNEKSDFLSLSLSLSLSLCPLLALELLDGFNSHSMFKDLFITALCQMNISFLQKYGPSQGLQDKKFDLLENGFDNCE
jgi:hypothetical protein